MTEIGDWLVYDMKSGLKVQLLGSGSGGSEESAGELSLLLYSAATLSSVLSSNIEQKYSAAMLSRSTQQQHVS